MRAPWLFRVVWLLIPFAVGPLLADSLTDTATPGRTVVSVGLWAVWALTLVATVVPRPATLTMVRMVAPASLAAAGWAGIEAGFDGTAGLALGGAAVAAVLALDPALGEVFVNGSAYGPEHRFPLRILAAVVLGPLPVAWIVGVAGLTIGPLLLAYEQWVAGGLATAIGVPAAGVAIRSLHALSRRWLVFVPGGLVIHDPMTLREPVLLPGTTITAVAPAPAEGDDRLDLTGNAAGLALQIDLEPAAIFGLVDRPQHTTVTEASTVLVTPTRPNRVLQRATDRRPV